MTIRQVVEELKAEGTPFVINSAGRIRADNEDCPLEVWTWGVRHDLDPVDAAIELGLTESQASKIMAAADNDAGSERVRRILLELVKETP